ncbi:MAG: hypothetical protein SFZ23_14015 [Planctomycetota bacterium]|nr:hypothetical protein [Planctomycetota bacterium]
MSHTNTPPKLHLEAATLRRRSPLAWHRLMVLLAIAFAGGVLLGLGGCASGGTRSTRLQADDFQATAVEVAAKLSASDWLRERGPDSPPIIVTISSVENLSSDIITQGERWYLMERLVDSDALAALRRERNIRFVLNAERAQSLRIGERADAGPTSSLQADAPQPAGRAPTHAMHATLQSITRAAGLDRTEVYACQYRLVELASGETIWTDRFEFKRAAVGRSYD